MGIKSWANKIEAKIAKQLRLQKVRGSGCLWYDKEDQKDDNFICQTKASQRGDITLKRIAVKDLIKSALISHKIPIIALYFEGLNIETWVAIPAEEFLKYKELIEREN